MANASWKGNPKNPVPNTVQEPIAPAESRSEKHVTDNDPTAFVSNNRAEQVRRDTDTQKDFTITLYDIDEAILMHLEQLQLQVVDQGKVVKVPVFFGPPERWVSAQRDGYIRDKQGKVILPAMILKRSNSGNDDSLKFFNRYLDTPVMKLYSDKNKYTKFSALVGQNVPVNEIYNVLVPKHMVLTYHFIVWTAYVEQMNKLIETLAYNTQDYWGSKKGFRFRTQVDSGYSHNVEIQAGDERIVRSEFDLITHGYILPDMATYLERHKMTTKKALTRKKMILGMEVVRTDFELNQLASNAEKWRHWHYPNLRSDADIPTPPVVVDTTIKDSSFLSTGIYASIKVDNSPLFLRIVPPPYGQASGGQDGDISYDSQYFYVKTNHKWRWVAISEFVPACSDGAPLYGTEGSVEYNNRFFYIYSKGQWRKVAVSEVDLGTSGQQGDIMYDSKYFYIHTGGQWRSMALSTIEATGGSCGEEAPPEGYPPGGAPVLSTSVI